MTWYNLSRWFNSKPKQSGYDKLVDVISELLKGHFPEVKLPALKGIEGREGVYVVYAKDENGGFKVARYVHSNLFEKDNSIRPHSSSLVKLTEEEFKDMKAKIGEEYLVSDFVAPLTPVRNLI